MTLFAPRPEYPYDARRQKVTGSGVALITVDSVSGSVINVSMVQSAGNPLLDRRFHRRFKSLAIPSRHCE